MQDSRGIDGTGAITPFRSVHSHRPAQVDFDVGHIIGYGAHGCFTAVLGGATRSRIGLGVTSHEAM